MYNKMNLDMKPETEEEKALIQRIEKIESSEEVKAFICNIKSVTENLGAKDFSFRVKGKKSALRTFRIKGTSNIDDMTDLCGMRVITDCDEDSFGVAKKIKEMLQSDYMEEYNLIGTANRPSEIVEAKKNVRPLSLNILSQKRFSDIDEVVPIEIVIQDKCSFLAIESTYYSLYKNDEIDPDERKKLLKCMNPIMMLRAQIDMGNRGQTSSSLEEEFNNLLFTQSRYLGRT